MIGIRVPPKLSEVNFLEELLKKKSYSTNCTFLQMSLEIKGVVLAVGMGVGGKRFFAPFKNVAKYCQILLSRNNAKNWIKFCLFYSGGKPLALRTPDQPWS